MPKIGTALQLNLQLFDGATNKFVRAYLRDADGVVLAASPVALTHKGEGLYSNDAVTMPNTRQVTAVYRVFDDAGFTTASTSHADALDIFDLELDQELTNVLTGIVTGSNLNGVVASSGALTGFVEEC